MATILDLNTRSAAESGRIGPTVVLLLAVAQSVVTAIGASRVAAAASDGPPSPVAPSTYAFAIWFPIFALSILFGVWQALPKSRTNRVAVELRGPLAGAFATICGWSIVVPLRLEWAAQIFLLGCWGFLATAFLRLVALDERQPLSVGERWCAALPVAPFLGWVTAANAVSLHAQAVRYGLLQADSAGSIATGAFLLALSVAAGLWLLRRARSGSIFLWGVLGATLLWALTAVVVEQRDGSRTIFAIGIAGVAATAAAMLLPPGERRRPPRLLIAGS